MSIHIEIFAFCAGHAHGAIWLHNGTAIPISMSVEAYETAKANGLFLRDGEQDDMYGVLNETNLFYNFDHVIGAE